MKTLLQIDKVTWGKVKYFATVKQINLNSAVEILLTHALSSFGYSKQGEEECRA